MKKTIASLTAVIAVLVATFVWAGGASIEPSNQSVGATSTMVLPAVKPLDTNEWVAATAYSIGDYVRFYTNSAYRYYWCSTAGTSGSAQPTWSTTNDVTDNTVTWRMVNQRSKFEICNLGSSNCFAGLGKTAVVDKGIFLRGAGADKLVSDFLGAVYCIIDDETNTIAIHQE